MSKNESNVSASEAKAFLASIEEVQKDTERLIRPPIWLNIIISGSFGMGLFSWASTRHENLWMLGVIISAAVFVLALVFYVYTNRLLGMKLRFMPRNVSELKFAVIVGSCSALLTSGTRLLSKNGFWIAPYIGGVLSALLCAYLLHFYVLGEYKSSKKTDV